MNATGLGAVPLPLADRVDVACDRFEAAWQSAQRPVIEDYLNGTTEQERSAILQELLTLELELRHGQPNPKGP